MQIPGRRAHPLSRGGGGRLRSDFGPSEGGGRISAVWWQAPEGGGGRISRPTSTSATPEISQIFHLDLDLDLGHLDLDLSARVQGPILTKIRNFSAKTTANKGFPALEFSGAPRARMAVLYNVLGTKSEDFYFSDPKHKST